MRISTAAATLFDLVNDDTAPEVDYYRQLVERGGGPALDVGCGPGRLMRGCLRAGLDVEGCDISPDMLGICRHKAAQEGLSATLYQQSMAELDLGRTYRTIFVCGSFGLNGSRADDLEALDRFHRHLEQEGMLALDIEVAWAQQEMWMLCAHRNVQLPTRWRRGYPTPTPEGDKLWVWERLVALDPLEQFFVKELRYELERDGEIVQREPHVLVERWYGKHELMRMLESAGFRDIAIEGDYMHVEANADHRMHVYIARK
jgi:SAM-dependent methyltransferase